MKPFKFAAQIRISDQYIRMWNEPPRPGQIKSVPKSEAWLKQRAEFVKTWEALEQQGIDAGYLDSEACYECGGRVIPTTDTEDHQWVPA